MDFTNSAKETFFRRILELYAKIQIMRRAKQKKEHGITVPRVMKTVDS